MHQAYPIRQHAAPGTIERSESARIAEYPPYVPRSATPGIEAPALASLIGNTPLIPLTRVTGSLAPTVALNVKLEGLNPGGSVKDRAALFIVRRAFSDGTLTPGKTLLDATSGNTGIAYAMLGAIFDFPVQLALPADTSRERLQILRAYGAQLTLTDPADGTEGARQVAEELAGTEPERFFYADQYDNPANRLAHAVTTGPEIWDQTAGRITHFVAGLGTGGTMTGVGGYLKGRQREIQLIGVQPDGPRHGISGLKHLETADTPGNYDPRLVDLTSEVSTQDALNMARRLARHEGLFVGVSAAAAVVAALRIGRRLTRGVVVALLPDGGFKYASAPFWAG